MHVRVAGPYHVGVFQLRYFFTSVHFDQKIIELELRHTSDSNIRSLAPCVSRGRSVAHLATPESLFPQELAANGMIVQGTAPPRDDENRSVHRFPNHLQCPKQSGCGVFQPALALTREFRRIEVLADVSHFNLPNKTPPPKERRKLRLLFLFLPERQLIAQVIQQLHERVSHERTFARKKLAQRPLVDADILPDSIRRQTFFFHYGFYFFLQRHFALQRMRADMNVNPHEKPYRTDLTSSMFQVLNSPDTLKQPTATATTTQPNFLFMFPVDVL
jgi:hypothetical protein